MHRFMKKTEKNSLKLTIEKLINDISKNGNTISKRKVIVVLAIVLVATFSIFAATRSMDNLQELTLNTDGEFALATSPMAATSSKTNVITIPTGVVKANPFLPYRTLGDEIKTSNLVNDVPKYDLIAPPDFNDKDDSAAKIMETVVSGILFDKYSPTAILKIEGQDYLVKKGDTVHNYKVLNIAQNSVTVQYGKNTYQAGIGELLSGGELNQNDISNLNKKFGGVKQ